MSSSSQVLSLLQKCQGAIYVLAFLFCLPAAAKAQTLQVAAAADLQFVLPELATQYEKESAVKLQITYGSSGNFSAQIQNGARQFFVVSEAVIDLGRKAQPDRAAGGE